MCSAAIASNLALGDTVPLATQKACRYVEAGISNGNGGMDYFHSTYTLPFSPYVPFPFTTAIWHPWLVLKILLGDSSLNTF